MERDELIRVFGQDVADAEEDVLADVEAAARALLNL